MEILVTQASYGLSCQNNHMVSPSDPVNLGHPCNNLFEFQVVNRYVFIVA